MKTEAVILAAGKGKRVNLSYTNKVLLPLFGKALIDYPIEVLAKMKIPYIVVVGYKKEIVKKHLGKNARFVEQDLPTGTGGAVVAALDKLGNQTTDILIMFGDHSFFYNRQLISDFLKRHKQTNAVVTVLTVNSQKPGGYGRVIRGEKNQILAIFEEKNLTEKQKEIQEVVTGLYCFRVDFLQKYKDKLRRHTSTGEYYLSDFVALANEAHKKVAEYKSMDGKLSLGVNTLADLERIEKGGK